MILYPDQTVEQLENETMCFAAPIYEQDWQYLFEHGRSIVPTRMRYCVVDAASDDTDVYFMRNGQEITDRVCVLLREQEGEDTCIESAAWIRIQENFPGMIYICRKTYHEEARKWYVSSKAAGAPQHMVAMVELPSE